MKAKVYGTQIDSTEMCEGKIRAENNRLHEESSRKVLDNKISAHSENLKMICIKAFSCSDHVRTSTFVRRVRHVVE